MSLVLISLEDLTRCIIRATKRNKGDLILISFLFSFFFFFPVCHERHHHVKISLSQLLLLIHSFNFPVCSSSSNINIVTALTISDPDPLGHRKKTCWDTNPNIDRTLPSFIYIESNPIPGYNIRDIFISTAGLDCCCVIAKHQNIVFLKRLNHKIFKFILLLTDTKFTLVECCCAWLNIKLYTVRLSLVYIRRWDYTLTHIGRRFTCVGGWKELADGRLLYIHSPSNLHWFKKVIHTSDIVMTEQLCVMMDPFPLLSYKKKDLINIFYYITKFLILSQGFTSFDAEPAVRTSVDYALIRSLCV